MCLMMRSKDGNEMEVKDMPINSRKPKPQLQRAGEHSQGLCSNIFLLNNITSLKTSWAYTNLCLFPKTVFNLNPTFLVLH